MIENNEQKELKNKLLDKLNFVSIKYANNEKNNEVFKFSEEYKYFLDNSKTERMAVKTIVEILENNGFKNINTLDNLTIGDKVYFINNNKAIYAINIKDYLENGINIIGSHIDSPRLDIKPNPLYEQNNFALFKTHYYGGIKKYQWTTIPLMLTGVIYDNNNNKLEVNIGNDINDPVFTVSDLLPHLARNQMMKKGSEIITSDNLNVLIGSTKLNDGNDEITFNILKLLNEKYNVTQKSFKTAELSFVPSTNSKDLGLDRSMILGYGQDDKVCAYMSLRAFIEEKGTKTSSIIFADKEEVGSDGNTGMSSQIYDVFLNEVLDKLNINTISKLGRVYMNSNMLSSDVDGRVDPNYIGEFEVQNNSKLNCGIVINKYTGSGGKYSASDASSEYLHKVATIFENNNLYYQVSELGKVDAGGGGTIAYIMANKGINVIDCGLAVLSMHGPMEITNKYDIYETYLGYKAFYENM